MLCRHHVVARQSTLALRKHNPLKQHKMLFLYYYYYYTTTFVWIKLLNDVYL